MNRSLITIAHFPSLRLRGSERDAMRLYGTIQQLPPLFPGSTVYCSTLSSNKCGDLWDLAPPLPEIQGRSAFRHSRISTYLSIYRNVGCDTLQAEGLSDACIID